MKKYILIGILIAIISFFVANYFITKNRNYEATFNGKIQKIEYDGKNQPTVWIGDTTYGFSFGREKNELMIGDSLVKLPKSRIVYHYRNSELMHEYEW